MIEKILKAARAERIPEGFSGRWYVKKRIIKKDTPSTHHGRDIICPKGTYTYLYRITELALKANLPGIIVMEDTPFELRTHLDFMLKASGRVLVTGLGLGCVVRGLLANPKVTHVTCIEKSEDVLNMVQSWMPVDNRLKIIHADALEWTKENTEKFDYAWHDLWTNREKGEPHLSNWHTRLLINCKNNIRFQGAWDFPRPIRRMLKDMRVSMI